MGLTGGVKSHRLSGQILPYCEKKRHWLCAYCAPMFVIRVRNIVLLSLETVESNLDFQPISIQNLKSEPLVK